MHLAASAFPTACRRECAHYRIRMAEEIHARFRKSIAALEKNFSALKSTVEEVYSPLTELTNESLFLVDRQCRYLFITKNMATNFDAPMSEVIGKQYGDLHTREVTDIFAARVAEVFATGRSVTDEHRNRSGDKYIYRTFAPVKLPTGEVTKIAVIGHDITALKETEAALKASRAKYHDLYEYAPDTYYSLDMQTGRITECNETFLRVTGYTREEVLGRSIFEFYTPDCVEEAKKTFERFADIGEVQAERNVVCKDGRIITVCVNASAMRNYGRSIWHDITERTLAENALKESETRYRRIIEAITDYIYTVRVDEGKAMETRHGAGCRAVTGYSEEEFATDPYLWLHMVVVEDRPAVQEQARRVLAGEGVSPIEHRIIRKDGIQRWVRNTPVPRYDAQGRLQAYDGLIQDISDRKRAEEEYLKLTERLRRVEKMEAIGTLAGGVAHDLNNVLGVLVGYSELLLHKLPEGDPSRNYVKNILASSEKGASIVQDLLTLARRGVSVSEVINLNRVVSDFLKSPVYEKLLAYHPNVTFRTDLSPDLLNIKGSPIHLEKTVMNLISNAAEAISEKGEVTIRTENRYLDKAIHDYDQVHEGHYVVLTISDNGGGIEADDIGKIFEPFYTKKVMGRSGTGLGLAVVWGTVKDHSGYIDVQSDVGKGSTFTLYFPSTQKEMSGDQMKTPLEQYRGRGESILVVDDVREQREMAASMLTTLGYQVQVAPSGEEALAYLKSNRVDLMLLDMIMSPGIDGLETYRRVLEVNPLQKAVLVSGFSETERVKEALELGAGSYVRKPYQLETIGMAIRNELSKATSGNL